MFKKKKWVKIAGSQECHVPQCGLWRRVRLERAVLGEEGPGYLCKRLLRTYHVLSGLVPRVGSAPDWASSSPAP